MSTPDFWKQCADNRVVIVPIKLYSHYRDGNTHEGDFVGIRYGYMIVNNWAVLDPKASFYVDCDDSVGGHEFTFETPEEALAAAIKL